MKTTIRLIITIVPFLWLLAAWPKAQAVVPPPDGGYPNFTTAEGQKALFSLTTGAANTAVGWSALLTNAAGSFNTATGAFALLLNTTGNFNTANGFDALFSNTEGQFNTADGSGALDVNTTGDSNTAIGSAALQSNTEGDNNTAVGANALDPNITGNNNTVVGSGAGGNIVTANNVICIGAGVNGDDVGDSCFINNIFTATSINGIGVLVNGNGKLGNTTSSRRFKEAIKPMDQLSEALFALKPVSFHCKKEIDPAGTSQLGLVAEDVEKVNPDLVVRDKGGKPYSVRYVQVNAMLLNEFLKEHRKVQEQEAAITQLKKDFDSTIAQFTARLHEQAEQIQKVNAQLEANKPAPQVVNNP